MRRKGERPVARELIRITPGSPVVRMIAGGEHWFYAWVFQQCTPWPKLSRVTGIPVQRFHAIDRGDYVSRAEIDALARAWGTSSDELIKTLPSRALVVD